jgi:hypothetical protein
VGDRSVFYPENRSLSGTEGELVSVRVNVEPRFLEDLLETLAQVSFPINPQIYHGRPTVVEFPAYQSRLDELRHVLERSGFDPSALQVCPMLYAISVS